MTYDGNIKNQELLSLREYVTHDSGSLNKADSTVQLMVTHSNLKARFMEIRFDRYVSDSHADRAPSPSRLDPDLPFADPQISRADPTLTRPRPLFPLLSRDR